MTSVTVVENVVTLQTVTERGAGIATGGTTGQILSKASAAEFDTVWSSAGSGDMLAANNLSDLANAATSRVNLSVEIGVDVQAWDADLDAIAALANTNSNFIVGNGSTWIVESGATARTSMGALGNIVEDITPQLGGNLDLNTFGLGDGTNLVLDFVIDVLAVNHIQIENEAAGSGPIIRVAGADTNADLNIEAKGTGVINLVGNVVPSNLVDGRDVAADGIILDALDTDAVLDQDYNANTILAANADDTPLPLTVAEQRLVGRITAGNITDLTAAQVRTLINVADGSQANTVDTVHGRTGTIVSATSDYDAVQIDVTPAGNIASTDVQNALEELDTEKLADVTGELWTNLSDVVVNSTFNHVLPHWDNGAGAWKDNVLSTSDMIINSNGTQVESGGVMTIDADTTKFDITAYHGLFVDNFTDPDNPTVTHVTFTARNALTVTNLVADPRTFVGIRLDNVVPSGGSATAITDAVVDGVGPSTVYLVQSPIEYTQTERRDVTVLGILVHPGSVIQEAVPLIQFNASPAQQLTDLTFALGPLNISGNVHSANGANLNIDKSAGSSFKEGVNIDGTAAGYKRPDISDDTSDIALTFRYRYQDGSGGISQDGDDTTINPDLYDDGDGTLGTVTANDWTIQPLWMFPGTGNTRIMYGQVLYNSMAEAESGITDGVVTDPNLVAEAILRGWLIVKEGTTDLSGANALFISAGKFVGIGGAGSATGEINTASNVGTDGLGVFKQKTGVDLEFKNVAPASSKLSVVANGDDIDLDVVPGNINTNDLNNDAAFIANVMTTQGDTIFGGTSGVQTRLPKGTASQVLTMNAGATAPEWAASAGGTVSDLIDTETILDGVTIGATGVNWLQVTNAAAGNGAIIGSAGTSTDIDINIIPKGAGNVLLGNFIFNADQTVGAGQDNFVLTWDNAAGVINLEAATGGLSNIVEDTTPQLGGNLDVQTFAFTFGLTEEVLKFSDGGTAVNEITISNAATTAAPSIFSTGDDANIGITITPKADGAIILDGLIWPIADGTTNQALTTSGSAQLAFTTVLLNIVEDTTPQLGGQLDVNGNAIGNGTEELITFVETGSAVIEVEITNAATGGAAKISTSGEANGDLDINTNGTGTLTLDDGSSLISATNNIELDVGKNINIGAAGVASGLTELVVTKTAITDNVATAMITVTVPNTAQSAVVEMLWNNRVSDDESARVGKIYLVINRVNNANTVTTFTTIDEAIATAGTETLTQVVDASSLTGASTAEQTFNIQVTLNTSASTTANTTVYAQLLNGNATGVTMAAS